MLNADFVNNCTYVRSITMAVPAATAQEPTIFRSALPCGVGSLTVAGVGVAVSLAAAGSTITLVTGLALATIGAYAFFGVVITAVGSRNAADFQANVWTGMTTAAGTGLAELVRHAVRVAIEEGIKSLFNSKR
jgi:hypothetical protein